MALNQIRITLPRRWWTNKTYSRELAGAWTDLDDSSRLFCIKTLLAADEMAAKIKILQRLLDLPKGVFFALSDDNLSALVDKLDWMKLEGVAAPIVRHFKWKGKIYHLPKAKFEDGVAIEFPMADRFLEAFTKTGEVADLMKLVGTLAREKMPTTPIFKKSPRALLLSREDAENRAEILRGLPLETAMSVLLYFVGIKEYIAQNYGQFLFDEDEEDDVNIQSATAHFPNFGWWSAYLQIAESGVFGNYEQVLQTNFHRVIMFLIEKRKEAKRQRAAFSNQKTD